MGDFTLPSLPLDFIPNFLTQPFPINNDTKFPEEPGGPPPLQIDDPSREDRFPKGVDFDELLFAFNNLSQNND